MATELKLRRGTTSQHSTFTGAEAEVTVDTDKETVVVHDGATAGGYSLAREDGANVSNWPITGKLTALDAEFTGSSAITLPDGTTLDRPGTPDTGMVRFNSDTTQFEGYDGASWGTLGGGATGGAGDQVFVTNDQVVTADYTLPSNKNASTTGPIEIQTGVTVTVSDGSRWVVI